MYGVRWVAPNNQAAVTSGHFMEPEEAKAYLPRFRAALEFSASRYLLEELAKGTFEVFSYDGEHEGHTMPAE